MTWEQLDVARAGCTHILLLLLSPEPRPEPPKLELKLELKPGPELEEDMADRADEKLLPPMRPPLRAARAGLAELSICICQDVRTVHT